MKATRGAATSLRSAPHLIFGDRGDSAATAAAKATAKATAKTTAALERGRAAARPPRYALGGIAADVVKAVGL